MILKNQIKPITVQNLKNVFGAVVSPIKLEITTVPNSKIVYRAVFSKKFKIILYNESNIKGCGQPHP